MANDADERVKRAVDDKLDSGMRWLLRREIEQLPRLVPEGEEIELLAQGRLDEGTGMIVVTGLRLLFVEQGVSHRRVVDLPYRQVESVQADVSVVSSDISVRGFDGEETTIGRVYPKAMTMEIADYVRVHTSSPSEPGHTLGRQPAGD
jgi:Bacterial PH domain